jgi:hypothetical protein
MANSGKTVKKKSTSKKSASKVSTTDTKKTAKPASSQQVLTTKATNSSKKDVTKKPVTKQPRSTNNSKSKTFVRTATGKPTAQEIDQEYRRRMIAETSYFIAERRGFVSGSPTDDWLEAEVFVDRLLESGEGNDGTSSASSK